MDSIATSGLWSGFFIFVLCVFAVDLCLLKRNQSQPFTTRQALFWTLAWITCALLFNLVLWVILKHTHGPLIAREKSLEFLAGYLIEESLSFDNMFVILMIFNFFAVPAIYQRRVLLYGVLGAIIMRFIMIFAGLWVINQFHWVLYLFGAFLIYTGIKMMRVVDHEKDFSKKPAFIWLRNHLRLTDSFHEEKFFVRMNYLWYVTPLFLTLLMVEVSDLVFALDSIPAIFAVTRDPFIVFTSNIFAILGLRAIYFLLANLARQFELLKYGIALVLVFVGAKIVIEHWVKVPVVLSLSVVATILFISILLSGIKNRCKY
ncbi:MAG TPA: TerC/Alx family metal homeostasis membrane protein [Gammaproteobacteria bacterium]|nr:TerC/Alx family metal homeostasis membrane protein [Gammaproteobacteria bacterium]